MICAAVQWTKWIKQNMVWSMNNESDGEILHAPEMEVEGSRNQQ